MKKLFIFIISGFIFLGSIAAQTITVRSPHSGDIWYKGNPIRISWVKSGSQHDRVKIRLYDKSGRVKILDITSDTANNGNFDFSQTIPDNFPNGDYVVRVKTIDNKVFDDSDVFSIASRANSPFIKVSSPRGPDIFKVKDDITIRWTTSGLSGNVKIILMNSARIPYIIRTSTPYDSSPLLFNIPETKAPGNYTIIIEQFPYGDSSEQFKIISQQAAPEVVITKFNINIQKRLTLGKHVYFEWRLLNLIQDVKIELLRFGGKIGTIVSRRVAGANSYEWHIGRVEEPVKILAGKGYSIRVCTIDGNYCDETRTFELINPPVIYAEQHKK